jgi:cell division protein ZapA
MAAVSLTLNGRTFRLACGDGEEHRLVALADDLQQRLDRLVKAYGNIGTERLLLMAALMINDELFEARAALDPEQADAA